MPVIPPTTKLTSTATTNSMGTVTQILPRQNVPIIARKKNPVGIEISSVSSMNGASSALLEPLKYRWCPHTSALRIQMVIRLPINMRRPKMPLRENTAVTSAAIASEGRRITYTSGCPKNQKRCWYTQLLPPKAASKKDVWKTRSITTMICDIMKVGNAVKLSNTDNTTPQTRIGNLPQVMPLVRSTNTVVMIFIAPTVVDIEKMMMKKQ